MANYVRRIVSGQKARFKDGKLNLELDLVYITDQIIIMGYPASGFKALYRNRREDAKKFLEHRHGKNYWVFNFCPMKENSYDPGFFEGRVSRYPFPDHHVPPLAIMPLVARETFAWLSGSPERVAVLHCKAGKGRSGTMACSYLLTPDDNPAPPRLERSYNAKKWVKLRAEDTMQAFPDDVNDDDSIILTTPPDAEDNNDSSAERTRVYNSDQPMRTETPTVISPTSPGHIPGKSFTHSLKDVLDLHTSRRMKSPSSPEKKLKRGVSIPSQRRWLYYWALILAHEGPNRFWAVSQPLCAPSLKPLDRNPKVRLTCITLRMRETSGVKMNLVRAANLVLERTRTVEDGAAPLAASNGNGPVWVSLARYDDGLVELLEQWEKHTRDENHMGRRRKDSDHMDEEALNKIFEDGKWDKVKMVRSFAKLGTVGKDTVVKGENEKDGKFLTYTLRPISDTNWVKIRKELKHENPATSERIDEVNTPSSEVKLMYKQSATEEAIVLDATREVRVKLYMGQVFMGWLWFIPTFYMPQSLPSSASSNPVLPSTKLLFTRNELDFPLGLGSSILDVEIMLHWLGESSS